MKKFLVATTAIVAVAAVASTAQAADPIKLSVGGFMQQWVGYAKNDTDAQQDFAKVLVQSDTELYFRGSTKLDNGLTVGINIDRTSDRQDTQGDDVFMSISSDNLGQVKLGATKGAAYGLSHAAPDVGIGHTDGDIYNWISTGTTAVAHNQTQTANEGNDGNKIVYLTPNFGGVQAGMSWGLDTNNVTSGTVDIGGANTGNDTAFDAAIAYNGDFGGVAVGADVTGQWNDNGGTTSSTVENYSAYRSGLSVGVAGFTVAGSYIVRKNVADVKDQNAKGYDIGVSYATGPYAVSASYLHLEQEDSALANAQDDERDSWMVSGSYDLGAGVSARASVFGAQFDDASNNTTQNTNDNEGFGVVAGLSVSF